MIPLDPKHLRYRVNYTNGQVSNTFASRAAAERERDAGDPPKGFVEFQDPDTHEWFSCRYLKENK